MMNAYYYMVYAFSALVAGALLDRYGARKTLPFAAASVGAFSLLLASGNERLAIAGVVRQSNGSERGVWIRGWKLTDMLQLECTISPRFAGALQTHANAVQKPVGHIVNRALADYLDGAQRITTSWTWFISAD